MLKFYIDGQWGDPVEPRTLEVINPATRTVFGRIGLGSASDVEKAVAAAVRAVPTHAATSRRNVSNDSRPFSTCLPGGTTISPKRS